MTAEAHAEVAADLALLDFGVVTQAETAAAASAENAKRMEAVLAASESRRKRGAYQHRQLCDPPGLCAQQREPGSPRITAYEASNVLHLRTGAHPCERDHRCAVRAGANQVQRLAFTVADDEAAQREALRNAVVKARGDAQVIAAALGLKLGAIQSVVEQEVGSVRPLARQAFATAADSGPATPIEPGQVEIRARVVLRTEIVQ